MSKETKSFYTILMNTYSKSLDTELVFDTVHQFSVFKSPFTKLSNITYITVEHDEIYLKMLDNEIRVNAIPQTQINIYLNGDLFHSLPYYIIGAFEEKQKSRSSFENGVKKYTFILVNPIIYWLSNNHSFVKLLSGRASDAITKYEKHLYDTFGDVFDMNKFVEDDPNPHSYGTILTRTENDLKVPYELMLKYKAYRTLGYYYYDDFNIRSEKNALGRIGQDLVDAFTFNTDEPKPISLNRFTFGGWDVLNKIDVFDDIHKDGITNITAHSNVAAMDFDFQINPDSAIVHLPSGQSSASTPFGSVKIPGLEQINSPTFNLISGRLITGTQSKLTESENDPRSYVSLFAPDNPSEAVKRFSNIKLFKMKELRSYITLEMDNVSYDIISLNNRYNINERDYFDYIPTAIRYNFVMNEKDFKVPSSLICNIKTSMCEYLP